MKNFLRLSILAIVLAFGSMVPAQSQIRFGVKAGMNVDRLSLNSDIFDSENRAGFTGGVMLEFTAPIIGVGFDLSAMYVRRNARFMEENNIVSNNRDYIDIPLKLKYKLSLPAISHIIAPFVTTGPSVSFLTSRKHISDAYKNRSVDCAWNFGLGVELVRKVQIHASYGLGLTKAMETFGVVNGADIQGKNRYWTVTAAYLF